MCEQDSLHLSSVIAIDTFGNRTHWTGLYLRSYFAG